MPSPVSYTNFRDGCRRRQKMNLEAQKRAPIYEALERFRKKRVVPVVAANRVGEERVGRQSFLGTVPGQTS